jgi:hypothetical protein
MAKPLVGIRRLISPGWYVNDHYRKIASRLIRLPNRSSKLIEAAYAIVAETMELSAFLGRKLHNDFITFRKENSWARYLPG